MGKGNICCFHSWNGLDKGTVKGVIEDAFGKKLARDYFSEEPIALFVDRGWKGIAILKEANGMCYLDKLAVKKQFQQNGIAALLLQAVFKKHPKVFWRASHKNPINYWYFKNCTGCIKDRQWNVFWRNLREKEIGKAVFFALNKKQDFEQ